MIQVETGRRTLRYSVVWRKTVLADEGNWAEVMSNAVGGDSITLITCAGTFDSNTLQYSDRLVVRAARLG